MRHGSRNDGLLAGLCQYFDQHGIFTQWYWSGVRGKLANFLRGNGWRIG